jgi:hypothetical protein
VNNLSIVNEDSSGISIAFPDVCQTPAPPAPPIPIPYPNIAQSSDTAKGTKDVTAQGKSICVEDSNFSKSSGDEAGTAGGGVASGKFQGKAEFMNYSMDTQFEGKSVPRSFDLMLHNDKNTPPFPVLQGPIVAVAPSGGEPKKADEPTPSASCDWCKIKLPALGNKFKSGASGDDVKKLQEHLKRFGMKVELSTYKDGKWQDSDDLSKGSWGPPTTRAVRMFGLHPQVGDEDEIVFRTSGELATALLAKKIQLWCDKKTKSPENYWEFKALHIKPGDVDALGSKDDPQKQTVLHDLVVQIERDLSKTGFAVHDDDLCGLKKKLEPKGRYVSVPKDSEGRHLDPHLGDMPHLVAKFQRQGQWLWRMKTGGGTADDAKAGDDSCTSGDPSGVVDAATAKALHHWASNDLHLVLNKFELTELHWPPEGGDAISRQPSGTARLRSDAADAWLLAAKEIQKLGATLQGPYADCPRGWKAGHDPGHHKQEGAKRADSAYSWHFSGLAFDLNQDLRWHDIQGQKKTGGNEIDWQMDTHPYVVELDEGPLLPDEEKPEAPRVLFRLWCWVGKQPKAPEDPKQDRSDALLQYRNRNIKTNYRWGPPKPAPATAPGSGAGAPAHAAAPGATPTPGAALAPTAGAPAGAPAPKAELGKLKNPLAPFDASPLYATSANFDGGKVIRLAAPEGWYVDLTAILHKHGLKRISSHANWASMPRAWEWWHYQFEPAPPPGELKQLFFEQYLQPKHHGRAQLFFAEYLQLIGVHEYRLRSVDDGWPAHEDVDHPAG